jgi:putative iron-regulated protein
VDITPEKLASLNELGGSEANVATGYHAIEFLLWGQDLNGTGPGAGNRPASDYLEGKGATGGHNDRRRAYLKAVTQLLVSDLEEMVGNWAPNVADNYRATLEAEPVNDGLRKMLFGMGSLSLGELAGERMKVSLEANSPEDEQDCFSDNTHNSHFYDAKGIRNVYLGEYTRTDGTKMSGPACRRWWPRPTRLPTPPSRPTWKPPKPRSRSWSTTPTRRALRPVDRCRQHAGNQIVRDAIAALVKQTGSIEQPQASWASRPEPGQR